MTFAIAQGGKHLARPNYKFKKRQKELKKQKKREEKLQRKLEKKALNADPDAAEGSDEAAATDDDDHKA